MHPLKHPRNAIVVGLIFVGIGLIYWGVPYFIPGAGVADFAGFTMLLILGVAMSIMAYVLIAGSSRG